MITLLGPDGLLARGIEKELKARGVAHQRILSAENLPDQKLGHVVCTTIPPGNGAPPPFAEVQALEMAVSTASYTSFLYLSTIEVYRNLTKGWVEDAQIPVQVAPKADTDILHALTCESVALAGGARCRVARLSCLYTDEGETTCGLTDALDIALRTKRLELSARQMRGCDYLSFENAVGVMISICESGTERIYNVASGYNVSGSEMAESLKRLAGVELAPIQGMDAGAIPAVDTKRIQTEFKFVGTNFVRDLPNLIRARAKSVYSSTGAA